MACTGRAPTTPGVVTETAADDRVAGRLTDKVAGRRHARWLRRSSVVTHCPGSAAGVWSPKHRPSGGHRMFLNQVHFIRGELQRARGWRLAIILGGPLAIFALLALVGQS